MRISDWSSDVCSSDLTQLFQRLAQRRVIFRIHRKQAGEHTRLHFLKARQRLTRRQRRRGQGVADRRAVHVLDRGIERSEGRRVGKEWVSTCRSRGPHEHTKKKVHDYLATVIRK